MNFIEKIETDLVSIGVREDDILHLFVKDDFVFDKNSQNWLLIVYKYLCRDKKRALLIEGGDFIRIKRESSSYINKYEHEFPILSNALVVNNTAHLLLARFFVNINRSQIPIKIFKNRDAAIKWSKQFKESSLCSSID